MDHFPHVATLVFALYLRRSFKSSSGFIRFRRFMAGGWSFFEEESFCASCAPYSHLSWENYSSTCFHQCLALRKVGEYICATRTL
jgi:hypothetical protein